MDAILENLDLNKSFFHQLGIIICFFALAKYALFDKLKLVLELRDSKTNKLSNSAEDDFNKATTLGEKYKSLIDGAYDKAQESLTNNKKKLAEEEAAAVSKAEQEAGEFLNEKRQQYTAEIEGKRAEVMAEANSLTKELVSKITN